jgi:hypothetical protein
MCMSLSFSCAMNSSIAVAVDRPTGLNVLLCELLCVTNNHVLFLLSCQCLRVMRLCIGTCERNIGM